MTSIGINNSLRLARRRAARQCPIKLLDSRERNKRNKAAQQANPYDMNQAYLDALANPGKVTTPGATVAQSAPPSNQSGVLQQFLANWKNQGSPTQGAGNYNNSGFFNALKGMV